MDEDELKLLGLAFVFGIMILMFLPAGLSMLIVIVIGILYFSSQAKQPWDEEKHGFLDTNPSQKNRAQNQGGPTTGVAVVREQREAPKEPRKVTGPVLEHCPEHPEGWIMKENGKVVAPCDFCKGRTD